jgi:hypothetical protein
MRSNGHALKLPARKCTRRDVWSMTCSWRVPATHIYRPAGAPVSFKRRLESASQGLLAIEEHIDIEVPGGEDQFAIRMKRDATMPPELRVGEGCQDLPRRHVNEQFVS